MVIPFKNEAASSPAKPVRSILIALTTSAADRAVPTSRSIYSPSTDAELTSTSNHIASAVLSVVPASTKTLESAAEATHLTASLAPAWVEVTKTQIGRASCRER